MYEGIKEMVAISRKTGHPFLVDVKTYRYRGHSMSDPAKYRSKDELDSFKEQDPISNLKVEMIEGKLISEAEFTKMDTDVKAICEEAVDFAEKSPEPPLQSMYEDIYAD